MDTFGNNIQILKAGIKRMEIDCSASTRDGTRSNGLKLHQQKFRLGIHKNILVLWMVKHWPGQPRDVVESPSLQVFKQSSGMV